MHVVFLVCTEKMRYAEHVMQCVIYMHEQIWFTDALDKNTLNQPSSVARKCLVRKNAGIHLDNQAPQLALNIFEKFKSPN